VQLTAAREVQRVFLALPAARRPEVAALALEHELRPTLAAISAAIVARAADIRADPAVLSRTDPDTLAGRLDASMASLGARTAIARAIAALREPGAALPERLSTFGTMGVARAGDVALWPLICPDES